MQNPKIAGAWNLHHALRDVKLDFFILASSISSLCGLIGQANYAAANSFIDAFAKHRQSLGLPAVAVNLGAVGEIGCFVKNPAILDTAHRAGMRLLTENEVIDAFHVAILQSRLSSPDQARFQDSRQSQVILGMSTTRPHVDGSSRYIWGQDARFRLYANIEPKSGSTGQELSLMEELREQLSVAKQNPAILKEKRIEESILRLISTQLDSQSAEEVNLDHMARTAIESLVFIEIKSWVRRNLNLELSLADISGSSTWGELVKRLLALMYDEYSAHKQSTKV